MAQAAQNYAALKLDQQVQLAQREAKVRDALASKSAMWLKALTELTESHRSFVEETNTIAPTWPDAVGKQFVQKNRNAEAILEEWVQKVGGSDIPVKYTNLGNKIVETEIEVIRNYNAAQEEIAEIRAPSAALAQEMKLAIEEKYQKLNAAVFEKLDQEYDKAGEAVTQATSGPEFQRVLNGGAPTGPGGPSAPGQTPGSAPPGGADEGAQEGGEQPGQEGAGAEAGAEQGAAGGADAGAAGGAEQGAGEDPSLSGGLGGAPIAPPPGGVTIPPGATVPPPVAGSPSPMVPFTPAAFGTGVRAGGSGGGGGGGGGVRVPGVGVGGSAQTSLPVAAAPTAGPSVPTTAAAPTLPGGAAPAGGVPGGPGGGMPPMMPPMGAGMGGAAAGLGGSGGGPGGPGAVSRPRSRKRDDGPTPGLPAMLSGKAGGKNTFAFSSRSRSVESDVPTTVQLIDEDLWQVDENARAAEQPAPVRRVRN